MKKRAIFFDRDGTLIKTKKEKNKPKAIKNLYECKIFPSVKWILKKLSKKYLLFVITNQPDVFIKKNTVIYLNITAFYFSVKINFRLRRPHHRTHIRE